MLKYLLFLTFFILFFPANISAQIPSETLATNSPQVRNRLQLLSNLQALNDHFNRFHPRLQALINRLRKINMRLERRLAKLIVSRSMLDRLTPQITRISADLDKTDKELLAISNLWQNIMNNKSREDFQTLKKRLTDLLNVLDNIVSNQKNLVKEMKKYKVKPEPKVKVTTNSAITN